MIYDLLVKKSEPLELREDPEQGVQVAGLKHTPVGSPDDILVRVGFSCWFCVCSDDGEWLQCMACKWLG